MTTLPDWEVVYPCQKWFLGPEDKIGQPPSNCFVVHDDCRKVTVYQEKKGLRRIISGRQWQTSALFYPNIAV